MTNVVIGYTGNVCSTPMVEYARTAPGVLVPVREEFDEYLMAKRFGDQSGVALARNLHALYRRRTTPYLDQPALSARRGGGSLPDAKTAPHILFKWRPFAPNAPGADDIRSAFHAHGVKPAVILRRSVTGQALKVFLAEKLNGTRHFQFKAAEMPDAEYAAFRARAAAVRVTVTPDEMNRLRNIARNFANRTARTLDAMAVFFAGGARSPLILAEDIFTPLIDRKRYGATLSRLLGTPLATAGSEDTTGIRKAGFEIRNCRNADEVLADAALVEIEARYQALLTGRKILSAP